MATSPGNRGRSERCSYISPGLPARKIRRLSPGKFPGEVGLKGVLVALSNGTSAYGAPSNNCIS